MTVGGLNVVFDLEAMGLRMELLEVDWKHWIDAVYWRSPSINELKLVYLMRWRGKQVLRCCQSQITPIKLIK